MFALFCYVQCSVCCRCLEVETRRKIIHPLRVFIINIRSGKSVLCFWFLVFPLDLDFRGAVCREGEMGGGGGGGVLGAAAVYYTCFTTFSHFSGDYHSSFLEVWATSCPNTTSHHSSNHGVDVPDLFSQSGWRIRFTKDWYRQCLMRTSSSTRSLANTLLWGGPVGFLVVLGLLELPQLWYNYYMVVLVQYVFIVGLGGWQSSFYF